MAPDQHAIDTFAEPGSLDPQAEYQSKELACLVWQAAASLRPEDYSLLELYVRQGLTADEMAEGLGVRKGTLYTRISRLKDALEDAVVAEMLIRTGRRACLNLDELVTGSLQRTSLRKAVHIHLQECEICQESKRRYASPVAIFAGLAPVPVPLGLKAMLWGQIAADVGATASMLEVLRAPFRFIAANKAVTAATAFVLLSAAGVTLWQTGSFEAAPLPIVGYLDLGSGDSSGSRTRSVGPAEKGPLRVVAVSTDPTPTPEIRISPTVDLEPSPTQPTQEIEQTPTATESATSTSTQTSSPTLTPTPSETSTPTTEASPSETPIPTDTATSEPPTLTPTFTPEPVTWESDAFDGLSLGPLAGQNGWFASAASGQVVDTGGGKAVQIDPGGGSTVIMGKNVQDQAGGQHRFEFDVYVSGGADASMAKIEISTVPNAGWDKKFQLYFGTSMRINYSGSGGATTYVSSTEMDRWYHIRCEIDLDSDLVQVFVDGSLAASEVSIHSGPIDSIGLSGWSLPGQVLLDNLVGIRY